MRNERESYDSSIAEKIAQQQQEQQQKLPEQFNKDIPSLIPEFS